jgi:hypothetical protein
MARRLLRRSRLDDSRRGVWQRVAFFGLPLVALALVVLPTSVTDKLRVWSSPVFSPLRSQAATWSLDMGDPAAAGASDVSEASLREQLITYQNAFAEMAGIQGELERQVRDLAHLRGGLGNLPCRLTPANFIGPEVPGGQAVGRLSSGSAKGIRKAGLVVSRRLNRGTREAIERGDPVLIAAGLVGVVDEVGPMTSTVRLVTDSRLSVMVQIVGRRDGKWHTGAEGVARGSDDGLTLTVQGIPLSADVQPGDFVVTSPSRESPLPSYLAVGRVKECEQKPAAFFRTLIVEPRVSLPDVHEVYVMSPETPAGGR